MESTDTEKRRDALKQAIGQRVKLARQHAGLTQEELLLRIGKKSVESISNIERGASLPPLDTLFELAACLKTDAATLIQSIDENTDPKRQSTESEALLLLKAMDDEQVELAVRLLRAVPSEPSD